MCSSDLFPSHDRNEYNRAAKEYFNKYDQAANQFSNYYNRLAALAQGGQQAATTASQLGGQYAQNAGGTLGSLSTQLQKSILIDMIKRPINLAIITTV